MKPLPHARSNAIGTILLVTVFCIQCTHADDVSIQYTQQAPYGYGAINVRPVDGGEYIYTTQSSAPSTRSRRVMIIGTRPVELTLMTSAEALAAWHINEANTRSAAKTTKQTRAATTIRAQNKQTMPSVNWPKSRINGDVVCVPETQYSSSVQWQDHLRCVDMREEENER